MINFTLTRQLVQKLRYLGFPIGISYESFAFCNFKLMTEILKFVMNIVVSEEVQQKPLFENIRTETGRVELIRTVTEIFIKRFQLKINPKKLYLADSGSVTELLKIVDLVFNSDQKYESSASNSSIHRKNLSSFDADCSGLRDTINSCVKHSINLYDYIDQETKQNRINRYNKLEATAQLDIATLEKHVKTELDSFKSELINLKRQQEQMEAEEKQLRNKLELKKQELERREKRVKSLKGVRPAFMDEYEKLESEIANLFSSLVVDYTNFDYLQHKLRERIQLELKRKQEKEAKLKQWLSKLEQNEKVLLRETSMILGSSKPDIETQRSKQQSRPVLSKFTGSMLGEETLNKTGSDSIYDF